MPQGPLPDPDGSTARLFADYLAQCEAGEKPDFASLCRDHPTEADALCRLRADWDRVQAALHGTRDISGSFAARLKQKYGEGVEPTVQLDEGPAASGGPATDDLVRRLSEHAPATSRYKLEGEVARGGMGAILRVWDEDLRRHLAMKVVLGRGDSSAGGGTPQLEPQRLARFLEEAQVTGQLDHPGIVPVHELGLDSDGRVYFTMKLVKGRDLKKIFDLVFEGQEGWNETRALGVILKVCEAMAYAHAKGVIHRDLKPANVMVGSFGEVFVMDWGLARVVGKRDTHDIRIKPEFASSLKSVKTERRDERDETPDSPIITMDGDVMGTPAYMPPEQARGEVEKLTARSDVFSMGAMLYHLLARHAPYVTPGMRVSNRTVLAMVLQGPPAPLGSLRGDVPAELVAICEKAMAREASRRYADTLALAEDLRAYLEHRVVSAYETGAWAETRKWVARNKPLAGSLAAAIVILVGGIVASTTFAVDAKQQAHRADENAVLASRRADETAEQARIAQMNEARANDKEREATQKANDVLSLSAIQELKDLVDRADALWPASPGTLGEYDRWLADAKVLIDGRDADRSRGISAHPSLKDHEAKLAEIRQRAKAGSTFEFDDPQDRWWHAQLSQLVADLKAFTDEKSGLFSAGTSEQHGWGIARRRKEAATIEERSGGGAEAKRRWDEAIGAIAKSPRFSGLKLTPQIGLLPIGEDPDSQLWEFSHLQTGEPPQRGADGKLSLEEKTSIVLVLIPGGKFRMGAQSADPRDPNYDPQALDAESPVHEVELSAYFLSKYEMTQGQWQRIAGRNPSYSGPSVSVNGQKFDLRHPVEYVSWLDCKTMLDRFGLSLPSEAQWENGCRGGTATPWWTGEERESLRGKVNIADQCYVRAGGLKAIADDWPDLDDGWALHAPAGTFVPNAFGLHEVHGNVFEWCLDGYDSGFYSKSHGRDPVAPWEGTSNRVIRGGSFYNAASNARSADRGNVALEFHNSILGVRPARAITP